MEQLDIQPMQGSEIEEAAFVLSQALLENPIQVAVYTGLGKDLQKHVKANFLKLLRTRPKRVFVAKQNSQIIGVYRTKLCTGKLVNSFKAQHLITLQDWINSTVEEREQLWIQSWASRDPVCQHSHLGPIGILPEFQHHGVGTLLLKHYCHWLNHQQLSAYLEADKLINVKFYEKFGFRVVGQADILGVQNYFMWRDIAAMFPLAR